MSTQSSGWRRREPTRYAARRGTVGTPDPALRRWRGRRTTALALWRVAVVAAALLPVLADGLAAPDADYLRMMRGMAVVKLLMALPAAWVVDWRLRQSATAPWLRAGYVLGALGMLAAPGFIWRLAALPLASALYHGGLVLLLTLALMEGRRASNRGAASR